MNRIRKDAVAHKIYSAKFLEPLVKAKIIEADVKKDPLYSENPFLLIPPVKFHYKLTDDAKKILTS